MMLEKNSNYQNKENNNEETFNFINKKRIRNIKNNENDINDKTNICLKVNDINNNKLNNNPKNIRFLKNIINKAFSRFLNVDYIYNNIIIIESIYNILYLIYSNSTSLYFYNLKDNVIMCKINKAHYEDIVIFRHYPDKINKKDYLLTLAVKDSIKLWDINKFECLLTLKINNIKKMNMTFIMIFFFSIQQVS